MNANKKLRAAMRELERWVLRMIRKRGAWRPLIGLNSAVVYDTLDRLETRGKIRFDRRQGGYVLAGAKR